MKNRYLLMCAVVVAATLAFTLAMYIQLPARIPTHWNAQGQIDGYGPRRFVFLHTGFMVVGFMVGMMLLWTVLPSSRPSASRSTASARRTGIVAWSSSPCSATSSASWPGEPGRRRCR
ncbi:MAG: hypothetical protein JWR40_1770 [Massilia sp.]|nr:hypothetical protein [Massilia sp.]